MRTLTLLALVGVLLLAGIGAGGRPSRSLDWSMKLVAVSAPARTIEIVDAVAPGHWDVEAAARWLGKRTGSRLKVVSRKCSATAYRCIRVQDGDVRGPVGLSRGTTVTIDTVRAARDYPRWYGKGRAGAAKNRTWLLVHELGHQFGLQHSSGANVMNEAVNRYSMRLTASQRAHLRRV